MDELLSIWRFPIGQVGISGPSVLVYSCSTPVVFHVFGQTITAAFGIIFVPSPYDNFSFNINPSTFSWTGK